MNLQVWEISKKFRNWCYGYLLVRVILSGDGGQRKAGILTGAPVAMRDIRPCSGWMLRGSHRRHKLVDIEYGPPLPETKPPGHRQTLEVKFSSEFHWVFQSTELHQAWSSWSLSLGGMEEGHDDHCLAFFSCLTVWAIFVWWLDCFCKTRSMGKQVIQLQSGQETGDVATSEAVLEDPKRNWEGSCYCSLKRQFHIICVEISEWKHTSLSTKSFLSTQLHLLSQPYQIWSFQLGNNAYKYTNDCDCFKKVRAHRKEEMLPKFSNTQKLFKWSVLVHKSQMLRFWWYVMRGTLGKVPARKGANKKVPLAPGWEETSELVNGICLHCLLLWEMHNKSKLCANHVCVLKSWENCVRLKFTSLWKPEERKKKKKKTKSDLPLSLATSFSSSTYSSYNGLIILPTPALQPSQAHSLSS